MCAQVCTRALPPLKRKASQHTSLIEPSATAHQPWCLQCLANASQPKKTNENAAESIASSRLMILCWRVRGHMFTTRVSMATKSPRKGRHTRRCCQCAFHRRTATNAARPFPNLLPSWIAQRKTKSSNIFTGKRAGEVLLWNLFTQQNATSAPRQGVQNKVNVWLEKVINQESALNEMSC